jgi:ankyrin repeat protein
VQSSNPACTRRGGLARAPGPVITTPSHSQLRIRYTNRASVLLLAAEDNCLGVNFGPDTPAIAQPFRPYTATVAEVFQADVQALATEGRTAILSDPAKLISVYAQALIQAFSCHLCLLQDEWTSLYEPHAFTSVAYGNADHRNEIRRLSREYARHTQYIRSSLRNLEQVTATKNGAVVYSSSLGPVITDLEYCLSNTTELKHACERFLEQQVSKISLEETRISILEARDLRRLSYLAFVFVPLSLASSWFGMHVDVLDGSTPLWVSVVISIGVLMLSMAVMGLTTSESAREAWERVRSFVSLSESDEDTQPGEHYKDSLVRTTNPTPAKIDAVKEFRSFSTGVAQPVNLTIQSTGMKPNTKVRGETPTSPKYLSPKKSSMSRHNPDHPSESKRHKKIPMNDVERRKQRKLQKLTPHNPNPYIIQSQYLDPPSGNSTPRPPTATTTTTITATTTSSTATTTAAATLTAPATTSLSPYITPAQHRPKRKPPSVTRLSAEAKQTTHSTETHGQVAPPLPELDAAATIVTSDGPHIVRLSVTDTEASPSEPASVGRAAMSTIPEDPAESSDDHEELEEIDWGPGGVEGRRARRKKSPLYQAVVDGDEHKMSKILTDDNHEQYLIIDAFWEASRARDRDSIERIIRAVAESDNNNNNNNHDNTPRQPEIVCCSAIVKMWDAGVGANSWIPPIVNFCGAVVEMLDRIGRKRGIEDHDAVQPGSTAHGAACKEEFLHWTLREAATWGNDSLVRYLVGLGVQVNPIRGDAIHEPEPDGMTLALACQGGHQTVMRTLLDAGADPNCGGKYHPLAEIPADISLARMLLDAGAKMDNPDIFAGAAKHGNIPFLEFLIATAADIDLSLGFGLKSLTDGFWHKTINGVLDVATTKGDGDMMRWLLVMGVDLNVSWKPPEVKDETSGRRPSSPTKRLTRGEEMLRQACRRGRDEVVSILLDAGVAGEAAGFSEQREQDPGRGPSSVLHPAMEEACKNGHPAVMEMLLQTRHVDPNHTCNRCGRFLYWASGGSSYDESDGPTRRAKAVKLLLQWGARVDGVDEVSPAIPLHRAIMAMEPGNPEVVEVLLEHGANVMSRSGSRTPLHMAAAEDNTAVMGLLLKWGAELDARDTAGETPLHTAARAGRLAAVGLLLYNGTDIDARDAEGWTSVHRAAWNKHKDVVKLLAARSADMSLETKDGLRVEDFLDISGDDNSDSSNSGSR